MSNPPNQSTDLRTSVTAEFDKYKKLIAEFSTIAASKITDASKIQQAAIHLASVTASIAADCAELKFEYGDDKTFLFEIVGILLQDGRVQTALGLNGALWDGLGNLTHFVNKDAFSEFMSITQDCDQLREELGTFCC